MKYLGLNYPIKKGRFYFETVGDTLTLKKNAILNLLSTRPGERRFQPEFGSRLWNYLFDPNDNKLHDEIVHIIKTDIKKWVNNIDVKDVSIYTSLPEFGTEKDNVVLIKVTFVDLLSKEQDTVEFLLKRNI